MNIPLTPLRFLRYAEQQYPRRTAVVCGNERFTYAQLAERVARLGGALRGAGVQPGDRVAFLSTNCHRLLEGYYGVLEAGAVLLPLNVRLAPQELAFILEDAGVKILFVEKLFRSSTVSATPFLVSSPFTCSIPRRKRTGSLPRTTKPCSPMPILIAPTSCLSTKIPSLSFSTPAAPAPIPKA